MKLPSYLILPTAIMSLASCTAYQQQGAAIGGVGGALLGAAFGDDHQDVVAGALVGAGVGAGAAALQEDANRRSAGQQGYQDQHEGPPQYHPPIDNNPRSGGVNYPTAQRTTNPDVVISPYPPHHEINVAGFGSGQLAKDPKSGNVFRIP